MKRKPRGIGVRLKLQAFGVIIDYLCWIFHEVAIYIKEGINGPQLHPAPNYDITAFTQKKEKKKKEQRKLGGNNYNKFCTFIPQINRIYKTINVFFFGIDYKFRLLIL